MMEEIQRRFQRFSKPRPNSDMTSEILNIVGWPVYVYTICCVVGFGFVYLVDYHYGTTNPEDGQPFLWYFQKCFACLIWIQMMSNWACIRYVDNSLQTEIGRNNANKSNNVAKEDSKLDTTLSHLNNKAHELSNDQSKSDANGAKMRSNKKYANEQPKRKSYWSWKRCQSCDLDAPPRCHHCPFCDVCVMKRDHHCFFAGRCVGYHNQRHFIVFLIWASFGTSYAMVHFIPYLYNVILLEVSAVDCFLPVTVFKLLTGNIDFFHANVIFSYTMNLFFILLSTGFFIEQYNLLKIGVTQFENTKVDKRKLKIVDPRPMSEKIKAVLGKYPVFSLVFPWSHWIYPPMDDPFDWPSHVVKHC